MFNLNAQSSNLKPHRLEVWGVATATWGDLLEYQGVVFVPFAFLEVKGDKLPK